ncbi:hypothetical protein QQP08_023505 [Theobroma cacao]|nr:hypothetical protein QQP08_023505 [Theobroma cacao]
MSDEAGQLSTCEKGLAELSKWISPESPTDRRSSVLVSQSLAVYNCQLSKWTMSRKLELRTTAMFALFSIERERERERGEFDESFSVFLSTNPYLKTYSRLLQVSQGTRAMEDQRAGFDVMSNCRWKT